MLTIHTVVAAGCVDGMESWDQLVATTLQSLKKQLDHGWLGNASTGALLSAKATRATTVHYSYMLMTTYVQ